MLDEGYNPYESNGTSSPTIYARRSSSNRVAASPVTPAAIRDFDFAAAMFEDASAWRELARVIASDAA